VKYIVRNAKPMRKGTLPASLILKCRPVLLFSA
jgi:hypothetical protein